jgi:glutaredoxin 2
MLERRAQTADLQGKIKRQTNYQSTIDKTRAMLKLIDDDIHYWEKQIEQGQLNKKTSITDAILTALYFCYLSQFNIDQRQQLLNHWQNDILQKLLPIRTDFNPLEILNNEKGFV